MKVKFNDDERIVNLIKEKLELNDGYCPCVVSKTEDTKCMCKKFRDQINAGIEGECHCGLYEVVK